MNAYDLPSSLTVGGRDYSIRAGWRHILRILEACSDPDVSPRARTIIILKIFYHEWKSIPREHIQEALDKASEFIDCGERKRSGPKLIDWNQDAQMIIAAVNKVSGIEVRKSPDIHWWTFLGWYMSIGESVLSSYIRIRQKIAKGEKLDKYEKEYYLSNKEKIDLLNPETAEIREEKENIRRWLNG